MTTVSFTYRSSALGGDTAIGMALTAQHRDNATDSHSLGDILCTSDIGLTLAATASSKKTFIELSNV